MDLLWIEVDSIGHLHKRELPCKQCPVRTDEHACFACCLDPFKSIQAPQKIASDAILMHIKIWQKYQHQQNKSM